MARCFFAGILILGVFECRKNGAGPYVLRAHKVINLVASI